jgi:dihydropteroate synthase
MIPDTRLNARVTGWTTRPDIPYFPVSVCLEHLTPEEWSSLVACADCDGTPECVTVHLTLKQVEGSTLAQALRQQDASDLAEALEETLAHAVQAPVRATRFGSKTELLGDRTRVMGVLNVTPDSFSDGGSLPTVDAAVVRAGEMLEQGADILDIGGESTRPGSDPVPVQEELERTAPVIEALRARFDCLLSIDTMKAAVADAAVRAGADCINDVTGFHGDPEMAGIAAGHNTGAILMHMIGTPKTMQDAPAYSDVLSAVCRRLRESMTLAINAGLGLDNLIVDPGIGFGKTVSHNLDILRNLPQLHSLGCPILVGTSRKSFIGAVLDRSVEERVEGTAATVTAAVLGGASIVRVHDVAEMALVARMSDAIRSQPYVQ